MALEKRWAAIPPVPFVIDGTTAGVVTLSSTSRLKVKQEIFLKGTGLETLSLQIKRVVSKTQVVVGPKGKDLSFFADVSAFTVAKNSTLEAPEQFRPSIPLQEHERAVYEEEPTVAKRVYLVDEVGSGFDENNPLPVLATVSDNAAQNPIVFRKSYATAGVEDSQIIPNNTKKLYVSVVGLNATLRLSYTVNGTIDGGYEDYTTIYVGNSYGREGVKLINKTLYYQCNKDNQIFEIEAWV